MAIPERLLAALSAKPAQVRFRRLLKLMELAGFKSRFSKVNPNIVIFFHPAYPEIACPMARRPARRFGYVEEPFVHECVNAVEAVGFREASIR